jgi:hypothetical protein
LNLATRKLKQVTVEDDAEANMVLSINGRPPVVATMKVTFVILKIKNHTCR